MQREQRVRSARSAGQIDPQEGGGVVGHARTGGVEVDVAHAAQQAVVAVDRARFVATFPQGAGPSVPSVELSDVASSQHLHELADRARCGRRGQQINVVVQQNISVQPASDYARRLVQQMLLPRAIDIIAESPATECSHAARCAVGCQAGRVGIGAPSSQLALSLTIPGSDFGAT